VEVGVRVGVFVEVAVAVGVGVLVDVTVGLEADRPSKANICEIILADSGLLSIQSWISAMSIGTTVGNTFGSDEITF
jgi:hypothetical protein